MLPEIPNLGNQVLQQWAGLIAFVVVVAAAIGTILKMTRKGDGDQSAAVNNPLANMPKYYMEGPIVKAFEVLEDIQSRVRRIEDKIDDWSEPDEDRRRRR